MYSLFRLALVLLEGANAYKYDQHNIERCLQKHFSNSRKNDRKKEIQIGFLN